MGNGAENGGRQPVAGAKIAASAHGMHQVVGDVDAGNGLLDRKWIEQVAGHRLDLIHPRSPANSARVAHENAHAMPALQQAWNQAPADIAGGARDKNMHWKVFLSGLHSS